jgi:apolipoprotein N-acyltransferase
LPAYWLSFEQLHYTWDLAWPWLALGNVFSTMPALVQWYEFTGVPGGSTWILIINILFFAFVRKSATEKTTRRLYRMYWAVALLLFPVVISVIMYVSYKEKPNPVKVAVIQPNIDPYNEKFSALSGHEQVEKLLNLASTVVDSSTDYVIGPETALPFTIWEHELNDHPDVRMVKDFMNPYPGLNFILGLSSAHQYHDGEKLSATARKFRDADVYYDSYNSAMFIDNDSCIQLYHKSKLVPGVEKMPYPKIFGFLEDYAIDMGGTSGSLGVQNEPSVFGKDSAASAPVICYESIFGNYIAEYVRKGAAWLVIITNDGWWGNTPGYRQHLHYARLRAIETRRSIARSANTGISSFINQRGDVIEQTGWWMPAAVRQEINLNNSMTIYSKYGNWVSSIAEIISLVSIILLLKRFYDRKN